MEQGKCIWVTANWQNTNFPQYKGNLHEFQHGHCQRSHNIVKVKPHQFHTLFLKLHFVCNCFCCISLSSVSHSEGGRSVTSSSLICVITNAVWELRLSPLGTNVAFADDFSKMGTWTPASLENLQQVERNLNLLPLQRKPLAGVARLRWVAVIADCVWDGSASWFGTTVTLCFLFRWVSFLWSHLPDQVPLVVSGHLNPTSGKQCVSAGLRGAGPCHTQVRCTMKLPHEKSIWSEASAPRRTKMRVSTVRN